MTDQPRGALTTGFPILSWTSITQALERGTVPDPRDALAIDNWWSGTAPKGNPGDYATGPSTALMCSTSLFPCSSRFLVWDRERNVIYPPADAAMAAKKAYRDWFALPTLLSAQELGSPDEVLGWIAQRCALDEVMTVWVDEAGGLLGRFADGSSCPFRDRFRAVDNLPVAERDKKATPSERAAGDTDDPRIKAMDLFATEVLKRATAIEGGELPWPFTPAMGLFIHAGRYIGPLAAAVAQETPEGIRAQAAIIIVYMLRLAEVARQWGEGRQSDHG